MPMKIAPKATAYDVKPPAIPSPGNNSFLGDTFTSVDTPEDRQLTCGFYRQEYGEPLVYHYDYDELKIILEVEGKYTITDETGYSVDVTPGTTFFFPKGCTITFNVSTPGGYGYAFFTGLRTAGTA